MVAIIARRAKEEGREGGGERGGRGGGGGGKPPRPPIIRARSLSSNSVAGATPASVPRLRNQDGIEKGISRLQLKLPTSISISAPIYSHRPYKRVCSYIGFSLYPDLSPSSTSSTSSFSSCSSTSPRDALFLSLARNPRSF